MSVINKLKNTLLVIAGTVFVAIGIIGIFVPLLPTTVFFLLAAYCYARSSKKFYDKLLNNKWFGSYIKNYREKKGISMRVKIISLLVLWITILYSGFVVSENIYVRIGLLIIAIGVSIHLLTLKTYKPEKPIP